MGGFEVRNNIALMVTVCIASFEVISELQKEKSISHVPQCSAGRSNTLMDLHGTPCHVR